MVITEVNAIKQLAINQPLVNMSSYGNLNLYENKATILYPFVNIDVVDATVRNWESTYKYIIYVCDRNTDYIAYNKAELILNDILKALELDRYVIKFFDLEFKDKVSGCYAEIEVPSILMSDCMLPSIDDEDLYLISEDGDFLIGF